jgi:hypothetical protein
MPDIGRGASQGSALEVRLDRASIERTCRFVKDEDSRITHNRAGKTSSGDREHRQANRFGEQPL